MRKTVAIIFIIAGITLMAYPKLRETYYDYKQEQLLREWENSMALLETQGVEVELQDIEEAVEDEEDPAEGEQQAGNAEKLMERMRYIEENMEGMLNIDRINLNIPILKGATEKNLLISVSSIFGTAGPGEVGNYCIAGHRCRTYGRHFNRLDELQEGDRIKVIKKDVSYEYEVFEKLIVKPEETWVLAPQGKEKLITLVTCDYSSKPSLRLIVRGRLIED